MLYPKESEKEKVLLYACRNCDHLEVSRDSCVYHNSIHRTLHQRLPFVAGQCEDPTLPRTTKRPCPVCGHAEAVFFQSHDRRRDTPMTLNFICCNSSCNHIWSD